MRQLGYKCARDRLYDKLYSDNERHIQVFSPHGVPIYSDTRREADATTVASSAAYYLANIVKNFTGKATKTNQIWNAA